MLERVDLPELKLHGIANNGRTAWLWCQAA